MSVGSQAATHWSKSSIDSVALVEFGTRVTKRLHAGTLYPVYGGGGATFSLDEHNRENCYIVSRFGMSEECVRRVEGKFFLNDSGLTVRTRDEDRLSQQFLDTYLLGSQARIYDLGRGAAQKNLNVEAFRQLVVPLPPLDEQKRIVAKLDQAFAALDRAGTNAEANLEAAAKLSESWLQELFEGSGAWPTHTLTDLCENLDRLRVPITKSDREPGDVPYYGASGVVDQVKGHLFDEDLLLVSEDGANLLARTYPIAFSISGKAWVNNHAHVLRFSDSTTQEFVRLYLNSISLKPYVTGMAQPKLNQAALNGIPVPMPAVDVRAEIVRKSHQISAVAARAADNYIAQSADIAALRQSLLQAAFSGQLT